METRPYRESLFLCLLILTTDLGDAQLPFPIPRSPELGLRAPVVGDTRDTAEQPLTPGPGSPAAPVHS